MAFCRNCGQQIPDDASACPNCGTVVAEQAEQQPVTTVYTPGGDADIQQNKSIAWLAYLGLFLLIPMLARKTSEFCKFHVKQGATLFCAELAYTIVTRILLAIIGAIFPAKLVWYYYVPSGVYTAFSVIFGLGSIFFLVLAIIGIVNAAQGEKKELPVFGKIDIIAKLMDKIYDAMNK